MNYFVKIVFISVVLIQTRISAQWNLVENLPVSEYSTVYEFNDTLYAGTGNRLYISADSGNTWNPSAVIKEEVDFISTILKVDNTIFVGTYAHGVFKSTNNGVSWTTFNNGLTGIIDIEELVQRGDSIYAGTIGSSIYAARIDGNAWSPFNNNIPMNIAGNVFALYNFNGRLITGSGANANIYYNDAGSTNWTEVPFTKFSSLGTSMNSIISKGSILYGTGSQGIYSSTDGGLTWLQFDPGFSFVENGSLQIYYNTVIAMIARISGTYYYSSSNNLTQWNLFEYQPGVFTYNFAILNNKIFASRFDGLYYTDI
ncbi:MAG: hypothetical protein HXY50_01545, partial [Ignavibacteriaceae bacterium]|nr:hypothetical protein [Ignavibacteriaceae bacterium]